MNILKLPFFLIPTKRLIKALPKEIVRNEERFNLIIQNERVAYAYIDKQFGTELITFLSVEMGSLRKSVKVMLRALRDFGYKKESERIDLSERRTERQTEENQQCRTELSTFEMDWLTNRLLNIPEENNIITPNILKRILVENEGQRAYATLRFQETANCSCVAYYKTNDGRIVLNLITDALPKRGDAMHSMQQMLDSKAEFCIDMYVLQGAKFIDEETFQRICG